MTHRIPRHWFVLFLVAVSLHVGPAAQSTCYDFGSTPVARQWSDSPLPLGCAAAPTWPQWRLFTPWHRAPAAHIGFNPGNAHAWPVLLFRYRCTGWLLLPVVIDHVRTNGYVIDQPEHPCATPREA